MIISLVCYQWSRRYDKADNDNYRLTLVAHQTKFVPRFTIQNYAQIIENLSGCRPEQLQHYETLLFKAELRRTPPHCALMLLRAVFP